MKTLILSILAGLSMFASADSHFLIFLGENNIEKLRPERQVMPDIQKDKSLRGDQIYWVRVAERSLPMKDLDKAWKESTNDSPYARSSAKMYDRILRSIQNEAPSEECDTIILYWLHGETDAKEGGGDEYAESVERFVAKLEEDLGLGSINLVVTRLSDYGLENQQYPDWEKVRKAQEKLVKDNKEWNLVDTDELNGKSNTLKFDKRGIDALGEIYTALGLEMMNK